MGAARPLSAALVGRDGDLSDVLTAIENGSGESFSAVVVEGEAGIGKSLLLEHVVHEVRLRGHHVLYAQADEIEQRMPYGALRQAVTSVPISPDLASAAENLDRALDFDVGKTVSSVYAAATRYFSLLRECAPTILVIDDLHLADDDTVAMVSALLRKTARHGLVLLGTLRKPHVELRPSVSALLRRLSRDGHLRSLRLRPLGTDHVAELVESVLGKKPDFSLIDTVANRTLGNPFFVRQAVLGWLESGDIEVDGEQYRLHAESKLLSRDRRTELLHRILQVSDDATRVARLASLMGSVPLGRLDLVAELADLSRSETCVAFDSLLERGILVRGGDSSFAFSHDLVRDALYQGCPPAQRWRWHREIAQRLRAIPATPDLVMEIASHMRETAEFADEQAIHALVEAADLTCGAAPRSSIPWFEQALSITPESHPERIAVLGRFARALYLAGRPADAARTGRIALAGQDAGPIRARLTSLVCEALNETGAFEDAVALIEREREAGAGTIRLLALGAHLNVLLGRIDEAHATIIDIERLLADAPVTDQIMGLVHVAHVQNIVKRSQDMSASLERALALAEEAPLSAQLTAYANAAHLAAEQGCNPRCRQLLRRTEELLSESGWTLFRAELAVAKVTYMHGSGDWDGALALVDEVAGELEDTQSYTYLGFLLALKTEILVNRGEWERARQTGSHRAPSSGSDGFQLWAASGLDLLTGKLDKARAELTAGLGRVVLPKEKDVLLTRLAEVALADGRPDEAAALLEPIVLGEGMVENRVWINAARVYGVARRDAGVVRESLTLAQDFEDVFAEGAARLTLGELGVDPETHLDAAYQIFHELGADPWRRRTTREMRRRSLKVVRYRKPKPTALTDLELQVARLVQQGSRNREIASSLSMSVKTVESYLTRIYAKTGTHSRIELARSLDTTEAQTTGHATPGEPGRPGVSPGTAAGTR